MKIDAIIFGVMIVIYLFAFLKIYYGEKKSSKYSLNTKQIVRIAIFGALSGIFYIFVKFPLPIFPAFLELHFDEVPVFIASFAYGPISGFLVIVIKTLIKLPFTQTLGVGEISDLIYSSAFILPASIIYKNKRNFKSVIIGLIIGSILQLSVSLLCNVYVMIPFYMSVMGFSNDAILNMCQAVNPAIKNIGWSLGILAVLPFNLMKNAMVIVITILTYKSVHRFIDNLHQ